jgi:NAD(P)-dependent dehydrogenase (short-subunit alcohol dehydrogenase family)
MRMTRAVLPHMRQQGSGRIINVSSIVGLIPVPFMDLYASSKHALEAISEAPEDLAGGRGARQVEPLLRVGPGSPRPASTRASPRPTNPFRSTPDAARSSTWG